MLKKGFTFIEVLIVIIIIGILASGALPRYARVVEKARSAEARNILGLIRSAELAYYLEFESYTTNATRLQLNSAPIGTACNASFYFNYSINVAGATFVANAWRCAWGTGKNPGARTRYFLNLTQDGILNCNNSAYL